MSAKRKYKVIVAGGRDFNNYQFLEKKLLHLFQNIKDPENEIEIVSGRARGADSLGEVFAKKFNIPVKTFPANWDDVDREGALVKYTKEGKPYDALAGHLRNEWMAVYSTHLVAFHDGVSTGTKNMIDIAKENGLIIKVYKY